MCLNLTSPADVTLGWLGELKEIIRGKEDTAILKSRDLMTAILTGELTGDGDG